MAAMIDYTGRSLSSKKQTYCLDAMLTGGCGGEGSVYSIKGSPSLVAKIYHENRYVKAPHDRAYQQRKLEAMLKLNFDPRFNGQWCFAWPQDILFDQGRMVGYVMPRINTRYVLNGVYNDTRAQMFPDWTWGTMTLVAYNLAVNIASLHRSGIVAGDLNPANIMVDPSNHLVSMIDCDSYEICDPDTHERFPCMVGSAEVLAPELQMAGDLSSPKAKFTRESDNFSLAILIFRLLMNGYDPFAKRSLTAAPSTATLSAANADILNGACIYVRDIPGMARPAGAPDFSILPGEIQSLFRQVFTYDPYPDFMKKIPLRPTADEWCNALDRMYLSMPKMKHCSADPHHLYPSSLSSCPWCSSQKDLTTLFHKIYPGTAAPGSAGGGACAVAAASPIRSPWIFAALTIGCSFLGALLAAPGMAKAFPAFSVSDMKILLSLTSVAFGAAVFYLFRDDFIHAASPWFYLLMGASMFLLAPFAMLIAAMAVSFLLALLKWVIFGALLLGLFAALSGG